MSLTKLIKSSIMLFKKDKISFLIIRRHDLGYAEETLRYISVKANSSFSDLRYKVWHLLDLPDFCDERIVLRTHEGREVPLTELRCGNDPQRPYVMEVWPPQRKASASTCAFPASNMLTLGGAGRGFSSRNTSTHNFGDQIPIEDGHEITVSVEEEPSPKFTQSNKKMMPHFLQADFRSSDLSCKTSASTLFRLTKRKSKDNFSHALLKMQTDLVFLTEKIVSLESKIQIN